MNLHQIVLGARIRTLALAVAPVWMGVAAAWRILRAQGGAVDTGRVWCLGLLCLGVALFMQIAANYANDYSDGVRGTDAHRAAPVADDPDDDHIPDYEELHAPVRLVASGVRPGVVLGAAATSAVLACGFGMAAVMLTGHWWLIFLGLACLLAAWCYVGGPHPYGYRGWGELAAFVFFGPVATCGTTYVVSGTCDWASLAGGLVAGTIALATIWVNNLRDLEHDRDAGKRTLAVRMGRTAALVCLVVMLVALAAVALASWTVLSMHGGPTGDPDAGLTFCTILGSVCVLLLGWFAGLCCIKKEYMRSMMLLGLLALAAALAYNGFALIL
ncbi:MAG: 1,4-dihydroxy-2-naphthoate octaprenyltransferase [Bifidobacterium sp.]|nr:1,4-dihydroxy-2-naphthoate octaprenyltransferase [Bifidobacterium sp.]